MARKRTLGKKRINKRRKTYSKMRKMRGGNSLACNVSLFLLITDNSITERIELINKILTKTKMSTKEIEPYISDENQKSYFSMNEADIENMKKICKNICEYLEQNDQDPETFDLINEINHTIDAKFNEDSLYPIYKPDYKVGHLLFTITQFILLSEFSEKIRDNKRNNKYSLIKHSNKLQITDLDKDSRYENNVSKYKITNSNIYEVEKDVLITYTDENQGQTTDVKIQNSTGSSSMFNLPKFSMFNLPKFSKPMAVLDVQGQLANNSTKGGRRKGITYKKKRRGIRITRIRRK